MPSLTIRIDDELDEMLTRLAKAEHRSKSELVRLILRRGAALVELRHSREKLRPYAEKAGYLTDEDFFRDFS